MKKLKPQVPIVLYSGRTPDTMRNVDVFINKDESTASFLSIVGDVIARFCS